MMIELSNICWVAVDKVESVQLRSVGGSVVTVSGVDHYSKRSPKSIIEEINELRIPTFTPATV